MVKEDDITKITRRTILRAGAGVGIGGLAVGLGSAREQSSNQSRRQIVGTSSKEARTAAKNKAISVERVDNLGTIGGAVIGRFSEKAIEELRKRDDVRYVERDILMQIPELRTAAKPNRGGGGGSTQQTLPWGINRVDAEELHKSGATGQGKAIAIVDTGIDSDHPDLQANIDTTRSKAFVACKGRGSTCKYPWDDDHGHGTHCAGSADAINNSEGVVGVATSATLLAIKVLDKNGSGWSSDVGSGITHAADNGAAVISLSLGSSSPSQYVHDACKYAYNQKGALVVAAAGNSGPCTDCVGYPAAFSEVVAVGATTSNDSLASFSSTGDQVEIAAPGKDILSTVPGGYATYSGTSMACPHVSGAAAVVFAHGSLTNLEVRNQLGATATDLGTSGRDSSFGFGLLDAEKAVLGTTNGNNLAS